jgi:hypothetical protein
MSRMADDFWQPEVDKRAVVKAAFEKLGITTEHRATEPEPVSKSTTDRLAAMDEREGIFTPPRSFPISPALADMLHYHPTTPRGPDQPISDDEAGPLLRTRGLDGRPARSKATV